MRSNCARRPARSRTIYGGVFLLGCFLLSSCATSKRQSGDHQPLPHHVRLAGGRLALRLTLGDKIRRLEINFAYVKDLGFRSATSSSYQLVDPLHATVVGRAESAIV